MSTSAFSSNDDAITRKISCQTVATSQDSLGVVYEIQRCISWIEQASLTRVALQFPDSLLVDAPAVVTEIQHCLPTVSIFILGDTSYGSCCVDEVGAEHYRADGVIHFGRACLSPTARLPVLYVFGRSLIDTDDCAAKVKKAFSEPEQCSKAILVYDTTYSYCADDVHTKLSQYFKDLVLSRLLDPSAESASPSTQCPKTSASADQTVANHQSKVETFELTLSSTHDRVIVCKCGRKISLPPSTPIDSYTFLFIGSSESPALLNMMMTFNKCTFYTYNPATANCEKESLNINRALMKRYYLVERAKDAAIVGIVAGTLGVARYTEMINHLKSLMKTAGKKSYTFVVGKLNPAKLANFAEVDIYVLVACPESSLLDQAEFYRPVVSPLEMEMACNQGQEWTGEYSTDFREILPGGSMYVKAEPFKESDAGDVSLINNMVRTLGVQEHPEVGEFTQQAVAVRSDSTAVANIAQNAGEFLAGRSWQGLERKLGESPVVKATEGQHGIAASYTNEPLS